MKLLKAIYAAIAAISQSYLRVGENIYEDQWDALIILDACRVDALKEVQDEYGFIDEIDSRFSLGGTSKEWIENTFTEAYRDEIAATTYITPNPFSQHLQANTATRLEYTLTLDTPIENSSFLSGLVRDDLVQASEFCEFVGLWGLRGDEDISQLHPEKVTDCAINTIRDSECDRAIIHYMQPHRPYLANGDPTQEWETHPFGYLRNGGDFEKVWSAYIDNLRLVLDYIEVLLENMDAETVVITADHGELFGEFGLYSHAVGIPHPKLRKVPWVTTTAQDAGTRNPDPIVSDETASQDKLQERLESLGYR